MRPGGRLTIVPTPIGNLEDITLRALRELREADIIACEDTRTSSVLLKRYNIPRKPLVALHLHNEREQTQRLIEDLKDGKNIAVISDAGLPGVSDPGYLLLRDATDAGFDADVLPGPSALLPALLLSGLPPEPFLFYGFPPEKPGQRKKLFASLALAPCTSVFYIAPHKAERQVSELRELLGDRQAAIVREISKIYQEVIKGSLSDIASRLEKGVKGEMVLVVAGRREEYISEESITSETWQEEAKKLLSEGVSAKTIALEISQRRNTPKNAVKEFLLSIK
ncbi:ribosomal RNA small subunit methyltransferase I [Synergistales bacterium]|nr:ribosomal RNA small subunit methyltransferase I [Synergistales bacterium]